MDTMDEEEEISKKLVEIENQIKDIHEDLNHLEEDGGSSLIDEIKIVEMKFNEFSKIIRKLEAEVSSKYNTIYQKKLISFGKRLDILKRNCLKSKTKFSFKKNKINFEGTSFKNKLETKNNYLEDSSITDTSPAVIEIPNVITVCDKDNKRYIYGPQEWNKKDAHLFNLSNCEVYIIDSVGAARMEKLQSCTVWIQEVLSSTFITDCFDCTFIFITKQARIHDSKRLTFYIQTSSSPIIEHCSGITVAPNGFGCNIESSDLQSAAAKVGMESDIRDNQWSHVLDFDWHKQQASPNWAVLPVEKRVQNTIVTFKHLGVKDVNVDTWDVTGVPEELKVCKLTSNGD